MGTPEEAKIRAATTYNSASDHYDDSANSFWERFGRRTVERLALRPGARVLMFAQTSNKEHIDVTGADLVVAERTVFGVYSADVDLQKESAKLVFYGDIPVEELVTHRVPLGAISSGFDLALRPNEGSLKIIVQPQRLS